MKRILLMRGKKDKGDYTKNEAIFQVVMFHGDRIGINGELVLFKNIFYMKSIFQPTWSFVVSEEIKQLLVGIKDFEFKLLKDTRFFEFDFFNDCTKEERKYSRTEKSNYKDYYKNIKTWSNENLELYLLSLPRIKDLSGNFEPVNVEIPDLDSIFRIHPPEIKKMPYYNCFCYNGYSFFKHEVFEKIERFIDKDFFIIREVDIPIESISNNTGNT